ncbi:MAG TPA: hypothetical protein PKI61_03930 [bacterium]|nr:hypothetical protein [bacterium]HPT29776.1 hypothetical protein [bacterium]
MKKIIIATIFSLSLVAFVGLVQAADLNSAFSGDYLNNTAQGARYVDASGGSRSIEDIVSIAITTVLSLLGIIFLGMIVYSGFLRFTAGGNEQKLKKSSEILWESVIGLLIVIGAYAISFFVMSVFVNNNKLG